MATETSTPLSGRRRRKLVAGAVGLAVAVGLLAGCLNPQQESVRTAMTHDRHAHGLRQLPVQMDAQRKAQAWAERLANDGYLHHSSLPQGINVRWCSLGENVGMGASVNSIEQAYMASPGHRANILATRWNGVGVGYAKRGNTIYTVHVFIKTC
jgi:uncharacterized protein YkwD